MHDHDRRKEDLFFFACAIRQLSSLGTLLGNSTALLVWPCCWPSLSWIHESGPESPLAPRRLPCGLLTTLTSCEAEGKLKCFTSHNCYLTFAFCGIIISISDYSCCFIMLARLVFPQAFFFLFAWESDRQDVECLWSGGGFPLEWGGKGDWIPSLGYSGKEGGHVPVCSQLWDGSRSGDLNGGGSCRVLWGHSLLSTHPQLLGLGWVGGRQKSPMMYTPQACWTSPWSWMGTMRRILLSMAEWSTVV